jgi:hypothetical protein
MLKQAPPGFAAWRVPVEPFLHQVIGNQEFAPALALLAAARAR